MIESELARIEIGTMIEVQEDCLMSGPKNELVSEGERMIWGPATRDMRGASLIQGQAPQGNRVVPSGRSERLIQEEADVSGLMQEARRKLQWERCC